MKTGTAIISIAVVAAIIYWLKYQKENAGGPTKTATGTQSTTLTQQRISGIGGMSA